MDTCLREVPKYFAISSEDAPICWVGFSMATDQPLLSAPIVWQIELTRNDPDTYYASGDLAGQRNCIVAVRLRSSEIRAMQEFTAILTHCSRDYLGSGPWKRASAIASMP